YRPAALDHEWKQKDPIDRVERLLEREGAFDDALRARVKARADETAAALRSGCLGTVEPEAMSVFDNVYADPHSLIEEERGAYATYLAGFEGA
ncbi:MAG: pyruvate dehydrogenase (acetyl-transferring) E1 component subunit alpha, partial [Rhodococcus sp. (in: high G+C Gram-positive bacteria)]